MKAKRQIYSKRNISILSIILCAVVLNVSIFGVLLVRFSGPILALSYGVFGSYQDGLRQKRLLCKTDHQALLAECRGLHEQLLEENSEIKTQEYIKVPESELSNFPLIRRLQGRVFANSRGGVWIELGDTFRHFSVSAGTEDYLSKSSGNHPHGNKELIPGLWYYDDEYNRDKDYDRDIESLLQKNKYR